MAIIAEITSDFEGTDQALATTTNSLFTSFAGTVSTTPKFDAAVHQRGTTAMRWVFTGTGGTNFSNVAMTTAKATVWNDFYLYVTNAGTAGINTAIFKWFAGATAIGDLRINALTGGGFALQIRDGTVSAYQTPTATPFATGTWYRVVVKVTPGSTTGYRMKVYTGSNIESGTATYDSGDQALTVASAVDNIKMGAMSGGQGVLDYSIDYLQSDDAAEPVHGTVVTTGPIDALTEGFEGGTAGTDLLQSPPVSFVTSVVPGGATSPAVFFADPYGNSQGCRFNLSSNSGAYRVQFAAEPVVIQKFAVKTMGTPTTSEAIISFYNGTTKVMDFQVLNTPAREVRIRDNATTRATSTGFPLTAGEYAEVALFVRPLAGTMRCRLYTGTARGTVTPTWDSGDVVMTNAAQTAVNEMRFGLIGTDTLDLRFDRFRADRSVEPAGAAPPGGTVTATVNSLTNIEPYSTFTLTVGANGGTAPFTYAFTQTGGTTTALTGTGNTRTGVAPAVQAGDTLIYNVTVTDTNGQTGTATASVAVLPHNMFVLQGGAWVPADSVTLTSDGLGWYNL